MGLSWSNNRRRTYNYSAYPRHHPHLHHQPHYPPPYYYTDNTSFPPPQNPQFAVPSYGVPPAAHAYCNHPVGYASGVYGSSPVLGRPSYHAPNGHPLGGGSPVAPPLQPLPYVEHHSAKKVRNVINVHKDTVRIYADELNPDHHLVSFVFDALRDGSITIFYFAKEETNCRFAPVLPEAYEPVKFSFQKGLGQIFCQPPGTGIDLGFFELSDLSKPSPAEEVFPLVISAETYNLADDDHAGGSVPCTSTHMQITQAVIEKSDVDIFQVRVIKQILWVDGVRYELREIYGLGSNSGEGYNDTGRGKDCVICMTEPKDTAVLPCRHMCMCSECAKELRVQSNKCPICRQPIEELIEIKINCGCS